MAELTHNKIGLAVEQLQTAISLFLSSTSVCSALTLSGAAEEVFGQAANIGGIENSLQESFRCYNDPTLVWLHPEMTWNQFARKGKNKVRNSLKHVADANDLTFEADLEDEAVWMLVRAIDNYQRLGFGPTESMRQFEEWFYENYVGI